MLKDAIRHNQYVYDQLTCDSLPLELKVKDYLGNTESTIQVIHTETAGIQLGNVGGRLFYTLWKPLESDSI